MTAGPTERAFRFLKRTSVNCGALEAGTGVTEAESGGVVLAGKADGGDPEGAAGRPGGDSSCASAIEKANGKATKASRVFISVELKSWRFAAVEQAVAAATLPKNSVATLYERRHI